MCLSRSAPSIQQLGTDVSQMVDHRLVVLFLATWPKNNWMASRGTRHREAWKAGHCHARYSHDGVTPALHHWHSWIGLRSITSKPASETTAPIITALPWVSRSLNICLASLTLFSSYTGRRMAAAPARTGWKFVDKVRLQLSLNLWFSKSMASWLDGRVHWMVACARAKSGCRHSGPCHVNATKSSLLQARCPAYRGNLPRSWLLPNFLGQVWESLCACAIFCIEAVSGEDVKELIGRLAMVAARNTLDQRGKLSHWNQASTNPTMLWELELLGVVPFVSFCQLNKVWQQNQFPRPALQ